MKSESNYPLVSVAVLTYNASKFIESTINSILIQDYPNIEIIISDDASVDNTVEIINAYSRKYTNKIKILTNQTNLGVAGNWFKCVSNCNGKYIIGLGGDDEFLVGALSKQVKIMESDPDIAICYADAIVFDTFTQKTIYFLSDKTPTKSGDIKIALKDCIYYSPTMMFRKKFLPKINIFHTVRTGSDIAFYKEIMILSAPKGKIHYLPEILYKYQKHSDNITSNQEEYRKDHINCIKLLQNKYPHYRKYLEPSIYDFCCVALFKNLIKFNFKSFFYFFDIGIRASNYNFFKFFRAISWGIKFYKKKRTYNNE